MQGRRGTGSFGVGVTVASVLEGIVEGVHLGALRILAGCLPRWDQDPGAQWRCGWVVVVRRAPGGRVFGRNELRLFYLCLLTSHWAQSPCSSIRTETAMLGGPREGPGRAGGMGVRWLWI